MKVKYIKCMDFTFEDSDVPDYDTIDDLIKAIAESKVIKVIASDGAGEYVNSNYIMFVGVYDEINKRGKFNTGETNSKSIGW